MLNIRNESPRHRRLVTTSTNGIANWETPAFDETLFDPICMASMTRAGDRLVWANPAGDARTKVRTNLTIRLSSDNGKAWPTRKLLEPGIAAYSDLAATLDGPIYCFYECGVNDQQSHTRSLRLATFDSIWAKSE
jgi:sialidase-1